MKYPKKHYEITQNLLSGKFILQGRDLYDIVSHNYDFYQTFFKESFRYDLIKTAEVIYLSSDTTAEKFSRNLMLVLAVLVDNINLQGKDLYEELYKTYKIKDIENIIQSSSYKNVCRNISVETLIKNDCQKRNIIDFNSEYETFRFTNAINVFLDKAVEIAHIDE